MPRCARPRRLHRHLLAVGLAVGLVLGGSPAVAADDDDAERRGRCSQGAQWRVEAKSDDGRIEVRGRVDGAGTGGRWRWRLFHNDSLSARGTAKSYGSDELDIRRVMTDLAGADQFSFRARNLRTGEWCRGPVSI